MQIRSRYILTQEPHVIYWVPIFCARHCVVWTLDTPPNPCMSSGDVSFCVCVWWWFNCKAVWIVISGSDVVSSVWGEITWLILFYCRWYMEMSGYLLEILSKLIMECYHPTQRVFGNVCDRRIVFALWLSPWLTEDSGVARVTTAKSTPCHTHKSPVCWRMALNANIAPAEVQW